MRFDQVGGQCTALYPEKPIYDIPGHPRIDAADLVEKLKEQAAPFKPVYHLNQQVEGLERHGESWRVTTSTARSSMPSCRHRRGCRASVP